MEKKTRKKEGIEEGAQIRREFLFIVSIFINRNKKKKMKKRGTTGRYSDSVKKIIEQLY